MAMDVGGHRGLGARWRDGKSGSAGEQKEDAMMGSQGYVDG